MPNTIAYSFGDVVLVPFPFTDQTASKKCPAVIVSSDAYHQRWPDAIMMAVTSQTLWASPRAFAPFRNGRISVAIEFADVPRIA
jgi:mRNA-degrading endonuclease toxin of MazEF toxin-antitoxin module